MGEEILIERDGYIATLIINRPGKRNALNYEVLSGLKNALEGLKKEGQTRVVVLRGMGDKAFSAGMDLEFVNNQRSLADQVLGDTLDAVLNFPVPLIAMINADALGAGCDLTTACDFRIAVDTARMGIPPVKFGWIYYPKSLQRLISLIGVAYTKELFLTARFVPAKRAKEMGLLHEMVPAGELHNTVYALANEIAEKAPLAVSGTKYVIGKLLENQKLSQEVEAAIMKLIVDCYQSEDAREGNRAFKENRKPNFKGC